MIITEVKFFFKKQRENISDRFNFFVHSMKVNFVSFFKVRENELSIELQNQVCQLKFYN